MHSIITWQLRPLSPTPNTKKWHKGDRGVQCRIILSPNTIISQGVGHPISSTRVCWQMTPKRVVYSARACAWSNNLSSR